MINLQVVQLLSRSCTGPWKEMYISLEGPVQVLNYTYG